MKNILLTGSGGFIGSHIKKHLKSKYNLLTPRSYELDLLSKESVEDFFRNNTIDFIIHSASYGVRISADATFENVVKPNLEMFNNLAKFAGVNCPMIVFGSGAEYDKTKSLVKVREEDFGISIPKDPYGYSKYLISKEIEKTEHILNLRIFGVYGPNEDKTRVTSCIINDNLNCSPILLNQNAVFDFLWIGDFCKITEFFIENPVKEKFINVTPSESIEIVELAKIVNSFSNYHSEIVFKKDGLNKEYTGDNSKLLKLMPYFTFTPYKDGLEILNSAIRENATKFKFIKTFKRF